MTRPETEGKYPREGEGEAKMAAGQRLDRTLWYHEKSMLERSLDRAGPFR